MRTINKIIGLILISSLTLAGCSKFDDFNTNPDNSTLVTPEMLATGALKNTFRFAADGKAYTSFQALPKYVAYAAEVPMEAQYNLIGTCSFESYTNLPNLEKMVEYATGTDYENSFKGLQLFIKAFNGYRLTMRTGDIPYSEAGKGKQGIQYPVYDTQESVLKAILEDLKKGEEFFKAGKNFTGDIIYGGDVVKWQKACNAMQLKVMMSMSRKITAEQKARFAAIVSSGVLMGSNADNLELKYTDATGTWHPLYNQLMFNSATVVSSVVIDALKNLNDRRLFYFAAPATAKITAGGAANDFNSYVGADPSMDFNALNVAFLAGKYSLINDRYTKVKAGDPFLYVSYAEQCFIIAEAIELGWVSGNSETYYKNGVTAALNAVASYDATNTYNSNMIIDAGYIGGYFAGEAAYKASSGDRLKQIWLQKYLMNFQQDGDGAFFEYRRTQYPVLPINAATSMNIDDKTKIPVRWKYPTDEVQNNGENLKSALKRQYDEYDGINKAMWLLK